MALLNGDAIPDIAVASKTASSVAIHFGTGGGGFQPKVDLAVGPSPTNICAGDIDGDADVDLVTVSSARANVFEGVTILKNNGTGTFAAPALYGGLQGAGQAVLADMDLDGRLDIVASIYGGGANASPHAVAILRNDGSGGFLSGRRAMTMTGSTQEAIDDFNRDGKSDVASVDGSGGVIIGLGNGDGTFNTLGSIGATQTDGVLTGDINRDGITDIVTRSSGFMHQIFSGVGDGTFSPGPSLAWPPHALLDLNRDGWLDILSNSSGNAIEVIRNAPGFFIPWVSFTSSVGFNASVTGDWDRDGDLDLAIAGTSGLSVFLFDSSTLQFSETVLVPTTPFLDVCTIDFDRDGILDLASRTGTDVRVFRGGVGGTFALHRTLVTLERDGSTVRAWDANLDGHTDLFASGATDYQISGTDLRYLSADLFMGNSGDFGQRTSYSMGVLPHPGPARRPLAIGDLDGNGVNDVLAPAFVASGGVPTGIHSALASPPAKGNAYQDAAIYATLTNPRTVAIGDVNRDGKPDVVSGSPVESPGVAVRLGTGFGVLGASTPLAQSWNTGHLELADFNRDGRLDIAASNTGFGLPRVSTMLGAGDGTFGARMDYYINAGLDFEVGDLNRDGVLDIVTASQDSIQMLFGTGTGTFTAGFKAAINPCYDLDLADLNRDGWLDVVCAGGAVRVFYNTGAGFGPPQTLSAPITTCQAVCVADLNRDGFLDIGANENNIYYVLWGAANYNSYATTTLSFAPQDVKFGEAESNGKPYLYLSNQTGFVTVARVEPNGTLTPVGTYTVLDSPHSMALGDLNGDASVDFVSVGSGTSFLAVNLHGLTLITGVGTPPPALASRPALRQNYPNPFNPRTTIQFELPRAESVRLGIYDVQGRLVATLHDGPAPAGVSRVEWRGQIDRGGVAASGVYFYQLVTASGSKDSRRMVVMK